MHTTLFGMVARPRWGWLVVLATTSACVTQAIGDQEPPPTVADVTPRQGEYGALLTVHGEHLERSTVMGRAPDGTPVTLARPLAPPAGAKSDGSTKGGESNGGAGDGAPPLLTFRFPFPAEGEMTLTGPHADIPLGAFTPAWTPGAPASLDGQRVLGTTMLGSDTVVLLDGPRGVELMVFGASAPRAVAVTPPMREVTRTFLRTNAGKVEALLATDDGRLSLVVFDGTAAKAASYDAVAGSVLGLGVDATGFVVVTRSDGDLVRLRGAPPALVPVGAPVPVPASLAAKKGVLAVAGDGTVVHAWSGAGGNFLDDIATFSMAGLAPGADDFTPGTPIGSLDDTFKSIAVEVRGGLVRLSYCAVDSGFFQSTKTVCSSATTVDGRRRVELEGSVASGDGASTFAAGELTYASCEGEDVMAVRSVLGDGPVSAGERTLYPCHALKVHGIARGDTGTRLVVERDGKLWAARRR